MKISFLLIKKSNIFAFYLLNNQHKKYTFTSITSKTAVKTNNKLVKSCKFGKHMIKSSKMYQITL